MEEINDFLIKNYTENKVTQMFDEEILEWVDSDWDEEYESEYDWYIDHNCKEAEDAVVDVIIADLRENLKNIPEEIDLDNVIREMFPLLK